MPARITIGADGIVTGIWPSALYPDRPDGTLDPSVPDGTVVITDAQYLDLIQNHGSRRWDGQRLVEQPIRSFGGAVGPSATVRWVTKIAIIDRLQRAGKLDRALALLADQPILKIYWDAATQIDLQDIRVIRFLAEVDPTIHPPSFFAV